MSLLDRVSVRLLASWPRWLGRVYLDTSVHFDARGDVVHTTVVSWADIPLQRSVEIFSLDPDGHRFTVTGGMTGSGATDPTGTRGEYALRWLGVDLAQHTVRESDRITIHQEGPGFHGDQVLLRVDTSGKWT